MSTLKFRTSFSMRMRTGKRIKFLNKRTLKTIKLTIPSILVVDIDYLESLISNKKALKQSNLYNAGYQKTEEALFFWINKSINMILPAGILYIAEKETEFNKQLPITIIYTNIVNYVYSSIIDDVIKNPIILLSNNLNLWLLSSNTSNLSFLSVNTNNRLLYYNNKTGLDILSKFIGTFKIINKLNLDTLKYLNLQYLFILLFYIEMTNSSDKDFYFDGRYFASSDKGPFLKSKGYGLSLITDAHKFLSYAFLTKPEFLDYFLLGNGSHYNLNLSRLVKLLSMDLTILNTMKRRYDTNYKPKHIAITSINLSYTIPYCNNYYTKLWNADFICSSYIEYRDYSKIINKYIKKYPGYIDITLLNNFPTILKKDFAISSKDIPKCADTISDDITDYVTNLIAGTF